MRRSLKIGSGLLGVALMGATVAHADAKWYDAVTASGYMQGSYVASLQNSSANPGNQGRVFDTNGNSFNFNTFLLQIAKPVGDDHYGFTARLRTGQDAAVLNGSTGSFAVQEAYITYVLPALTKLSFIGGKFTTPEGFEVVDSVSNPNFSEGLLFAFAEPITHTGIKANYVFSDMVNATVGVVNGWDVAPDNNSAKTILWQVATVPMKGAAWTFQGLYGKELADPTHAKRLSLDTVFSYTLSKLTLAAQGNWGQETNSPGTNHWSGLGVWASFAETDKCTTSARFEVLGDENGAGRVTTTPFVSGNTNQTIKEFTLTQKHMFTTALGTRLEYRHDWSNQAYFLRKDGSAVRNQNTISMDWFVTF